MLQKMREKGKRPVSKAFTSVVPLLQHHYLDDVAEALDELLLKINSLSDTFQHPLPEEHASDMAEARAEGGSLLAVSA